MMVNKRWKTTLLVREEAKGLITENLQFFYENPLVLTSQTWIFARFLNRWLIMCNAAFCKFVLLIMNFMLIVPSVCFPPPPKKMFYLYKINSQYSKHAFQVSLCAVCPQCPLLCVWQEGKQASLAADFSVTQFKHLGRLLMVHGRNSYKRSAALSQFVIHRSLCISTMQVD